MKKIISLLIATLLIASLFSCKKQGKEDIIIFHAGSLSIPFGEMELAFEAEHPEYDVLREAAGSRTCARKVSDLNKPCDIMASADYSVIDTLLIEQGFADWNIQFVTNEMSIMYSEHSKKADEITADNWYSIFTSGEVAYGHSDPDADPCGYRTLLTWQLAEKHYGVDGLYASLDENCPPSNIRSKETDLIALLEAGELDYIFIYRSVAEQHKMPFLILPDEINLKQKSLSDFYKQASVEISGTEPGTTVTKKGAPMIYGFTIPSTVQNQKGAELFAQFILSDEGIAIMEKNGQPFINPPRLTGDSSKVPDAIMGMLKGE